MNFLSSLFSGVKNLLGGAGKAVGNAAKGAGNALLQAPGGLANLGARIPSMRAPDDYYKGYARQGTNPQSFMQGLTGQAMANPSLRGGPPGFDGDKDVDKPQKKNWLNEMFPGGATQGIAGLAAPMIGDMFAPKSPQIPDMNSLSSVQAMQNFRPGNSVSPEYQAMLQRSTQQLRDTKVRELQQLYHNARPGTDYLTDSAYQRDLAKLDQDIQTNMSDDLARAEATFSQQEQERLSQIAQMDIYSIMAQTGMEAQEAEQFKEMFSNVGSMFLTNATKKPGSLDDIMAMFGGN